MATRKVTSCKLWDLKIHRSISDINFLVVSLVKMKQFEKSNVSKRQVSIAAMMSIFLFSFILILVLLINSAQATQTNQQESNFRDPLVWDSNTLYDSNKESNIVHLSVTRKKRSPSSASSQQNSQQVVDACQSKMEVITPYYATNSKGKLRTIVNSELMQQAIQVENCIR